MQLQDIIQIIILLNCLAISTTVPPSEKDQKVIWESLLMHTACQPTRKKTNNKQTKLERVSGLKASLW